MSWIDELGEWEEWEVLECMTYFEDYELEGLEELESLFLSEKQQVIADGHLQSPNDIAHCLMA